MNQNDFAALFAEIAGAPVASLKSDASLKGDLGMDSMKSLELIIALEERGVVLTQEQTFDLKTYGQLAALVTAA
jgi:acyl carrier protein